MLYKMVGQYCRVRGIRIAGGGSKMSLCTVLGRTGGGEGGTVEHLNKDLQKVRKSTVLNEVK